MGFEKGLRLTDTEGLGQGQAGADLFSNCTEECKALGHSDRCWMPSFMPSDGRQGPDYRSNLHVPGMDSVPDTERGKGFASSFRVDISETA
nr:PREDICTED: protocadherin-10-like [Paralichthys olivaceus]